MIEKPRFIIADQALRSMTGHFFEYDVSVAANVPERFEPLIVANSEAEPEVLRRAKAFFQCDFWGSTAARQPASSTGQVVHNTHRLLRLRKLARQIAAKMHLLPALRFVRRKLGDVMARLRAALTFGGIIRPPHATRADVDELNWGDRELRDIFTRDLVELFRTLAITADDVVFFPNMNHWTLAAIVELRKYVPPAQWPSMKLLFRRNIDTIPNGSVPAPESQYWAEVLRRSFDQLSDLIRAGQLALYTDTMRLKLEYAVVTAFSFAVLPIPFRHDYIEQKSRIPETFQVAFFGEARLEKGFGHLPGLVQQFRAERESGKISFVFQSVPAPEPEVLAAINQLKSQVGVTLLDKPLSDHAYYALLNSSDVVLLLYDPARYYSRSSCIFVESVVSATPSVTFADSWMASVMEPGTGEVVENASQIPSALRKILRHYSDYQAAIISTCQSWRRFHNPRHLVDLLLTDAALSEPLTAMSAEF